MSESKHTPGKIDIKGILTRQQRCRHIRIHDDEVKCLDCGKTGPASAWLADRDRLAAENTELKELLREIQQNNDCWWVDFGDRQTTPELCDYCCEVVKQSSSKFPPDRKCNHHPECLVLRVNAFLAAHQLTAATESEEE